MHTWLRTVGVCVLLLVARNAEGQACSEETQARADVSFRSGVEAFEARRLDEALTQFESAYEACSTQPATLHRLGLVHAELDHSAEAVEFLEAYVSAAGRSLDRRARTEIERLLARHRPRVGQLVVRADVPAMLFIDGRARVRLPLSSPIPVVIGERTIRVEAPGRTTFEGSVTVEAGRPAEVFASLPRVPVRRGTIRVTTPIRQAEIRLDGELVGETPLRDVLPVDVGSHVLSARRAGYVREQREVEVVDENEVAVEFRLELAEEREEGAWGRAEVVLPTDAAVVRIDGRQVDASDLIDLPVGEHELVVEAPGRQTHEERFVVRRGETATLEPSLRWTDEARADIAASASKRRLWGFISAGVGAAVAVGGAAYLAWGESRVDADELRAYGNCRGLVASLFDDAYTPSAIEARAGSGCYSASETPSPGQNPFFYAVPNGFEVTARGASVVESTEDRAQSRVVGGVLLGVGAAGAIAGLVVALTAPDEGEASGAEAANRNPVDLRVGFTPTSFSLSGSF
jgi:hypothetical protein